MDIELSCNVVGPLSGRQFLPVRNHRWVLPSTMTVNSGNQTLRCYDSSLSFLMKD